MTSAREKRSGPPRPEDLQALIFDLDGTLLDSMPSHVATWMTTFEEFGHPVPERVIYYNEGSLDPDCMRRIPEFDGFAVTPGGFSALLARQQELYRRHHACRVTLFPRTESLIDDLRRAGVKVAMATSSDRGILTPALDDWIRSRFSPVITRGQVRRGKPHPDPYLAAWRGLGVESHRVAVVENAPAGITAARRAGLACLALSTTLPPEDLSGADRVFPDLDALADWLAPRLTRAAGA